MRLHDTAGNRLYLNAEERAAFLAVARRKRKRAAKDIPIRSHLTSKTVVKPPISIDYGCGARPQGGHMLRTIFLAVTFLSTLSLADARALTDVERAEIKAQLDLLKIRAEAARVQAELHQGNLIGNLALARAETLALTRAILEARLAAEDSGAQIEIVVPAVEPDPARAAEIEIEIEAQEVKIAAAEKEVASSGGLIGTLAATRLETERLVLANLRASLFQARYGALLPSAPPPPRKPQNATPDMAAEEEEPELAVGPSTDAEEPQEPAQTWADQDHPDVDYGREIFAQLDREGFEIHGWWGMQRTRAAIDDSPKITAINVSEWPEGISFGDNKKLYLQCVEGEASAVYFTDGFIISDFRQSGFDVTVRVDSAPARTQRWSELTSKKGAGLFGSEGESFMRELYSADQVFLRLRERNGETHDATFALAGTSTVVDAVAEACGFSTLNLTQEDYRAIQNALNAAGYNAGLADGVWGAGSKEALRRFQEANDLTPTGAPTRETLTAMGVSPE